MNFVWLPARSRKTAGLLIWAWFIAMTVAWGGEAMEESAKRVEVAQTPVVGVAVRTTNAKEATGEGLIGKEWGRFIEQRVLESIPNRIGSDIVVLYTDYASDQNGEYTYLIGAKVKSGSNVPEGMVTRSIPAGKYAVFTTDRGPVAQVVAGIWKKIWSLPSSQLARAYRTDFEVYDQRAADRRNAQVDVYIGVK